MVAMFNGNPSTTIISCYHATNVSDETDLDTVHKELASCVRNIPKHESGDINA